MNNLAIDRDLVQSLVSTQFPRWKDLAIEPVAQSGWDNRTFHLGKQMLVRLPSGEHYALQVEKEQYWLPKLAPLLPLAIPEPLAVGEPAYGYPWRWSVYRWLEGETVASGHIVDLCDFVSSLARFLIALQAIDPSGGPNPGLHSFYRGGALKVYDEETRQAFDQLKSQINVQTATDVWETALKSTWSRPLVWVHGDVSAGNLLLHQGRLSAVIDFGQLVVGDPACDLAIAWTLFKGQSREIFRAMLPLDAETWARGRAWALWKALRVAAGFTNPNNTEAMQCWRIIDEVLADHLSNG